MSIEFYIRKNSHGYIVIRKNDSGFKHAHVSSMNGCRMLINLISARRLPTSKYLQVSCSRLLTEEEYRGLRQKKQRYVNVNKGVR